MKTCERNTSNRFGPPFPMKWSMRPCTPNGLIAKTEVSFSPVPDDGRPGSAGPCSSYRKPVAEVSFQMRKKWLTRLPALIGLFFPIFGFAKGGGDDSAPTYASSGEQVAAYVFHH